MTDRQRHVVILDAFNSSAGRLAPAFAAAGHRPVHVRTTDHPSPVYGGYEDSFPYAADILHEGDLEQTLAALNPLRPVAVLAGCETAVELADVLSEALGTPTNGTALSAARRDKYAMVEQIKRCGLRGSDQILVKDEDHLRAWHERLGRTAVLKPLRSAANDGVTWCRTPEDSVLAYRRLAGRPNRLTEVGDGVVAQECLVGTEYLVNTVSRDGLHHICDIWRTHRITANGKADLMAACQIVPATGQAQEALVPYTLAVLDALGIRHGAAHTEIKLTASGPCLIEVGARVAGQDLPGYAALATGESQIDWLVDAYTDPARFAERHRQTYQLRRHVAWATMVAPHSGHLRGYRALDDVAALESVQDIDVRVRPGEWLSRTEDDLSYPLKVSLSHALEEVLLRDLNTLRYLDGEGFYDIATDRPRTAPATSAGHRPSPQAA